MNAAGTVSANIKSKDHCFMETSAITERLLSKLLDKLMTEVLQYAIEYEQVEYSSDDYRPALISEVLRDLKVNADSPGNVVNRLRPHLAKYLIRCENRCFRRVFWKREGKTVKIDHKSIKIWRDLALNFDDYSTKKGDDGQTVAYAKVNFSATVLERI